MSLPDFEMIIWIARYMQISGSAESYWLNATAPSQPQKDVSSKKGRDIAKLQSGLNKGCDFSIGSR